jgi:hypothetical protein
MLSVRKLLQVATWPDPLLQERLEEVGFFYERGYRRWIRFCDDGELDELQTWLTRRAMAFKVGPAPGRGELKRVGRLSEALIVTAGGSPSQCALCGTRNVPCRVWIEGDDTDSIDYPGAARFYLCGACVQHQMQPHPRLYVPAEDVL